jgi:hypothetical protein
VSGAVVYAQRGELTSNTSDARSGVNQEAHDVITDAGQYNTLDEALLYDEINDAVAAARQGARPLENSEYTNPTLTSNFW